MRTIITVIVLSLLLAGCDKSPPSEVHGAPLLFCSDIHDPGDPSYYALDGCRHWYKQRWYGGWEAERTRCDDDAALTRLLDRMAEPAFDGRKRLFQGEPPDEYLGIPKSFCRPASDPSGAVGRSCVYQGKYSRFLIEIDGYWHDDGPLR